MDLDGQVLLAMADRDVKTWAPAAAAGVAALAAAASWASVRQSRREWRIARTPQLRAQVVARQKTGKLEIIILNAGLSPAIGVGFCVVCGDEFVAGFAGPNLGGSWNPAGGSAL